MPARRWSLLVLAAALATGAILAFAPMVATASCGTSSSGETSCSSDTISLVANEGASVLVVLAVPALIALIPVATPSRRAARLSAILLTAAAVLGAMSVGMFLIPTVVLAWLAARHDGPKPGVPEQPSPRSAAPNASRQ